MKLSVFGDFGKFTVVGLTKARLRMRLMKLSVLGETPNENMRVRRIQPMT
jgi:hypothetical protein